MADEIERIKNEVAPVVQQAGTLTVTTAQEYQGAAEFLKGIKAAQRKVTDFFTPIKDAAHKAWKSTVAGENTLLDPLKSAEGAVKGKMLTYQQAEERKRQEAERVAREAQAKESARLAKLQQEAEERAAAAAAAGNAKKAAADAAKAAEFAARQEVVAAAPVIVAPTLEKVKGISTKKAWRYEITDAALIPRDYLIPDEVKIGKVVRATTGTLAIPGIRIYAEDVIAAGNGR